MSGDTSSPVAFEPAAPIELRESVQRGVALLTIDRPDRRNALTPPLLAHLAVVLERLAVDPEVGAIVITGAGDTFCAGADVKRMAANALPDYEAAVDRLRASMEPARLLHEIGKPTLAMVNGAAAGAGLGLALAADFRFVARSAKLTTAFARVGLSGDFGVGWFLTQLAGPATARQLMFDPMPFGADAALAYGLAHRVVDDDKLFEETMILARMLASGPRVAHRYIKAGLNAALRGSSLADALDLEAMNMTRSRRTEDHAEGVLAFAEKRPPMFKGR